MLLNFHCPDPVDMGKENSEVGFSWYILRHTRVNKIAGTRQLCTKQLQVSVTVNTIYRMTLT